LTDSPVKADTILRTVELGVTIIDARLDADTTVLHYLLDDRRRHRANVTTGQIVPAGPRCPIWMVLQ
jgi:hypothetical protein